MSLSVQTRGWDLFARLPSPPPSETGERLDEMLEEAQQTHKDHFERRIEAVPVRQTEPVTVAAQAPIPVAEAAPQRSWPRTVAVSVVLLATAGIGTLATSIINALINKKVIGKGE